jgi:peptide/nickel transport system substrate-binding protein
MRRLRGLVSIGVAVIVAALVLAACSSSSTPSGSGNPSGGTKQAGGTATYAEAPNAIPNYIFPFMSLAFFSVYNINQFQFLMYRPLYWFGNGAQPTLNPALSLAQNPVYSNGNTTVVVNLKPYKWSNGETVTAQDVMFWMNVMHSDKANWAAYAPGFIPDDLKSISIDSPTQLTFTLTAAVNPYWFTYNELSQITPLPVAWDITSSGASAGSGGCSAAAFGKADTKCNAVYTFLEKESGYDPANPHATNNSLATYATNPIWQVVDGPWKLSSFDASGNASFVPNTSYSGSPKPTLAKFVELPFTTDDAEFNALVGGHVNFGFLPLQDVTQATSNPLVPAANNPRLSSGFYLAPLYTWSINYFPENFNSTGDGGNAGNIWKQLYVRQAFQYLIDQPLYIQKIDKGYGVPTYGPVPVQPANPFASSLEKSNPYPYSVTKAKSLLSSHGWTVVPNGTSTCTSPGTGATQCGANIPAGAKLEFNLEFDSGNASHVLLNNTEKSSWAQVGFNIHLSQASFNTVIGNATACMPGPSCTWELENWGAGWVYAPDYYPTGEEIFSTGAGSNSGSYSDMTNDNLTVQTNTTNTDLTQWENYLAKQLPVVWQPDAVTEMSEIQNSLRGVLPQDPLWSINPENWYFVK